MRLGSALAALLLALGLLSGCDSAEERAQKHYESALALLESGDQARAIVEFKNVFKLNPRHKAARLRYAELQHERGDRAEAIGQYQLLAEQFPDDLDVHLRLAGLEAEIGNWPAMQRPLDVAARLAPGDPRLKALRIVQQYNMLPPAAASDGRARALADQARALLAAGQEDLPLRKVVIDDLMRAGKHEEALAALDAALGLAPEDRALYALRLSVLGALKDTQAIEAQLRRMHARFPEDAQITTALVSWLMLQQRPDAAEAVLRADATREGAPLQSKLALLRFISSARGPEAAMQMLDDLLAGETEPGPRLALRGLRAGLIFDAGRREEGRAALEALLKDAPAGAETRRLRLMLARMHEQTGNRADAESAVDAVLKEDQADPEAVRIKAAWLIDADRPDEAIGLLRKGLERAPRDSAILLLLARAHERNGDRDLAAEMLALAAEASRFGVSESLLHARQLAESGHLLEAEDVLKKSLRAHPGDVSLLSELGRLQIRRQDWPRARQVVESLSRLETPAGRAAAAELENALLLAQNRADAALEQLNDLLGRGEAGLGADVRILRLELARNAPEAARAHLERRLAEQPGDPGLRYLAAAFEAATGDPGKAIGQLRDLLSEHPGMAEAWVALYRLQIARGAFDAAAKTADAALAALPDSPVILWLGAGEAERRGDLQAAIAIYERLHAQDSDNPIIANNLASLLATTRPDDPATLERAARIARRLRGSDLPPFQDTWGWIALLTGATDEALKALEPAAAALGEDPQVQYHLARAYEAAGRPDEARAQYARALDLAAKQAGAAEPGAAPLPFLQDARSRLAALEAEAPEGAAPASGAAAEAGR